MAFSDPKPSTIKWMDPSFKNRCTLLYRPLQPSVPSTALCSVYGLCRLYDPSLPVRPSDPSTALRPPLWPSILLMAFCFLNSLLSSLRSYVPSTALYPPLWYSVSSMALYGPKYVPSTPSTALCPFYYPVASYGPLSPLQPSVLSSNLCSLFRPLFSLQASVLSSGLCSLFRPLFSLQASVLSSALCPVSTHWQEEHL
jgi:hypothetical protein